MKAVILAAGRGSRFGRLTESRPKPLIELCGKPLIEYTLEALPREIKRCIIVLGYLGDAIAAKLGRRFRDLPIEYVTQEVAGTGGALLAAKRFVEYEQRFMVIGSDDIFGRAELEKVTGCHGAAKGYNKKANCGVGAYVLYPRYFSEEPARLANGELSIPHTLFKAPFSVETVAINEWFPVNNPDEKIIAEAWLQKNRPR